MKKWIALALALILALCACAGFAETSGEERYLKATLQLNDTLSGLKPISSTGYTFLMQWLFGSLMRYDVEKQEFVPALAEKCEVSEDGTVYTLTLRDGIAFSDGVPITADDVVFTYTWAIRGSFLRYAKLSLIEGFAEARSGEATEVSGIQKIDEKTVSFTLTQPNCLFMEALCNGCFAILPSHCFPGIESASEINGDAAFWEKPVSSGAYYVSETHYPNYIVLTRNENYYDVSGIEHILCTYYADQEASYAAMIEGNIDIMTGLEEENALNITRQNPDITSTITDSTYHRWLWVNTSSVAGENGEQPHPSLKNQNVRHALNMLFDRDAICQLYGSLAVPTNTCLNPKSNLYNTDIPAPVRDVEGAKKILDEEGYDYSIPLKIYANYTDQITVDFCELVVQNFADAGVAVEYYIDGNWQNHLAYTEYDLRYAANSSFNVIDFFALEACVGKWGENSNNYPVSSEEFHAYQEPRYDQLIDAYKRTLDPVEQKDILDQLQYNAFEDMCMFQLYCLNSMNLYNTAHFTGYPDCASDYSEVMDFHFSDWKFVD